MTNGAGGLYPDRLKEAEIPGLVRPVTICDIHAALTKRRPYKVRVDASSAYAILVSMAGRLNADLERDPFRCRCRCVRFDREEFGPSRLMVISREYRVLALRVGHVGRVGKLSD